VTFSGVDKNSRAKEEEGTKKFGDVATKGASDENFPENNTPKRSEVVADYGSFTQAEQAR